MSLNVSTPPAYIKPMPQQANKKVNTNSQVNENSNKKERTLCEKMIGIMWEDIKAIPMALAGCLGFALLCVGFRKLDNSDVAKALKEFKGVIAKKSPVGKLFKSGRFLPPSAMKKIDGIAYGKDGKVFTGKVITKISNAAGTNFEAEVYKNGKLIKSYEYIDINGKAKKRKVKTYLENGTVKEKIYDYSDDGKKKEERLTIKHALELVGSVALQAICTK